MLTTRRGIRHLFCISPAGPFRRLVQSRGFAARAVTQSSFLAPLPPTIRLRRQPVPPKRRRTKRPPGTRGAAPPDPWGLRPPPQAAAPPERSGNGKGVFGERCPRKKTARPERGPSCAQDGGQRPPMAKAGLRQGKPPYSGPWSPHRRQNPINPRRNGGTSAYPAKPGL